MNTEQAAQQFGRELAARMNPGSPEELALMLALAFEAGAKWGASQARHTLVLRKN